jgi:hypothetical protein
MHSAFRITPRALTLPEDWPVDQISAVMYGQTKKPTADQSQLYFQNMH